MSSLQPSGVGRASRNGTSIAFAQWAPDIMSGFPLGESAFTALCRLKEQVGRNPKCMPDVKEAVRHFVPCRRRQQ